MLQVVTKRARQEASTAATAATAPEKQVTTVTANEQQEQTPNSQAQSKAAAMMKAVEERAATTMAQQAEWARAAALVVDPMARRSSRASVAPCRYGEPSEGQSTEPDMDQQANSTHQRDLPERCHADGGQAATETAAAVDNVTLICEAGGGKARGASVGRRAGKRGWCSDKHKDVENNGSEVSLVFSVLARL